MRARSLLLEYDRQETIDRIGYQLRQRINKQVQDLYPPVETDKPDEVNDETLETIIEVFEKADPTRKKAFTLQLIRWFIDGSMRFVEDAPKATKGLALYGKFKNRGLKPLNQMTFGEFLDYAEVELGHMVSQTEEDKALTKSFFTSGQADLVADEPTFRIVVPKTIEASNHFGRGTRWCTTSENGDMFNHYSRQSPLFIVEFKGQPKKWQVHIKSRQFMNARDEELTRDEWMAEPEVVKKFAPIILRWLNPFNDSLHARLVAYYAYPDDLSDHVKGSFLHQQPFYWTIFTRWSVDMVTSLSYKNQSAANALYKKAREGDFDEASNAAIEMGLEGEYKVMNRFFAMAPHSEVERDVYLKHHGPTFNKGLMRTISTFKGKPYTANNNVMREIAYFYLNDQCHSDFDLDPDEMLEGIRMFCGDEGEAFIKAHKGDDIYQTIEHLVGLKENRDREEMKQ